MARAALGGGRAADRCSRGGTIGVCVGGWGGQINGEAFPSLGFPFRKRCAAQNTLGCPGETQ